MKTREETVSMVAAFSRVKRPSLHEMSQGVKERNEY